MRILIVDDNAGMRRMLATLLSPTVSEIRECGDGIEAGVAYRAFRPDFVLMDVEMPCLDGISATRQIIADDPAARIVVVTNHDEAGIRMLAIDAGASGFVAKDNLIELRTIVREILDR